MIPQKKLGTVGRARGGKSGRGAMIGGTRCRCRRPQHRRAEFLHSGSTSQGKAPPPPCTRTQALHALPFLPPLLQKTNLTFELGKGTPVGPPSQPVPSPCTHACMHLDKFQGKALAETDLKLVILVQGCRMSALVTSFLCSTYLLLRRTLLWATHCFFARLSREGLCPPPPPCICTP